MPSTADLMEQTLSRTFADPTTKELFGSGPDRAIEAYRSFWVPGTYPIAIIECPLMGAASYDVLVGAYGGQPLEGARLPEANPPACHAAYDWMVSLYGHWAPELFFELDADGPEGQHAGIHCRHRGALETAMDFYQVIGEGWRAPLYRDVVERLPQGWRAEFAAVFAGRPGVPTRLEVLLSQQERHVVGQSPAHLRVCFDQLGFSAYDDAMLKDISRLAAISRLDTLQFDILADGALGTTFSITSCFESTGGDFAGLFADDGAVGHVCSVYEQMGVADDRWRLAERALSATKRLVLSVPELKEMFMVSLPNCGKAKWIGAKPQPAKLYLTQSVLDFLARNGHEVRVDAHDR